MRNIKMRRLYITFAAMVMAGFMTACSGTAGSSNAETVRTESSADAAERNEIGTTENSKSEDRNDKASENDGGKNGESEKKSENDNVKSESSDEEETKTADGDQEIFTDRDLKQTAELEGAEMITLTSNQDISVTKEGVYVLSGDASNVTVTVDAGDEDKIQIVLDGVSVTNDKRPVIYVKSADKVFVTTTESENTLEVTGEFEADGDTNTDAVIFSKDDLVLNGLGTLSISSSDNAVSSKDTLKITGGKVNINCSGNAFEAHDAIEIADGTITVTQCNDGLHAEDSDDDSIGAVYISGGTFNIKAEDDAIHATTTIDIKGGSFTLEAGECIEGTYIRIDDGKIDITASDDGINAAAKSGQYTPTFEMNGGEITIKMGAGDTDGIDSNGNIVINGGTINVTGQSTFDYDGKAEYNGGTIIENGVETNSISNQQFGPGGKGPGGGMQEFDNMNPEDGFNSGDNFRHNDNFNPDDSFRPDGNFNPDAGFRPDDSYIPDGDFDQLPENNRRDRKNQKNSDEDDSI